MRLILFFLVVLVSCTNDPKLVQEFVSDKQQPIEQIKGAELLHTENGKVKVRVVASRIERFQDIEPSLIFSDHLEVYFYNDSSQLQSTLMADYASIDEGKKIMLAQNNVILISSDDKKLETDELIWDENKNKIYTDKKVKITTGKEVIYGEGFTSTSDFKKYSITKINGTFDFATQTH
ncbi:LPS export ABC transporter periplasmic protein LptC [Flavobacteriales bacterium]|jgi:LPS export ABC transporter protein LptC|nr:LPS export ABC transporter periplasmic protein LptC [Flavobacteriales bacterium]